jgi:pimeloyl-ACP methyl ester carboxylesterase
VTSPRAAAAAPRRLQTTDARPALAPITARTLVLHRREHPVFPLGQGRCLAEHIAGATLQVLRGREGLFAEDSAAIADAICDVTLATSGTGTRRP